MKKCRRHVTELTAFGYYCCCWFVCRCSALMPARVMTILILMTQPMITWCGPGEAAHSEQRLRHRSLHSLVLGR